MAQVMTRLDDALARHGIDTTTCMQRVACSYSRQAAEAMRRSSDGGTEDNTISTVDRLVDAFSSNRVLRTALEGTAIHEAVEAGRNGQSCVRLYRQCGVSPETMLGMLAKLAATSAMAATGTGAKVSGA